MNNKLKNKDKQIFILENEIQEMKKIKKPQNDQHISHSIGSSKVRELEVENNELKDKLSSTESNVSVFVKEMSELIDSHELSTNVGSDDNASMNNSSNHHFQDFEEEIEVFPKSKLGNF